MPVPFVASGSNVIIWDINDEAANAAAKTLGGSAITADVSDAESVTRAARSTLAITPLIDILVNNAGITGPTMAAWGDPLADWTRVFAVNVHGVFHCCRAVVPLMRQRTDIIASVAGNEGPNASAYQRQHGGRDRAHQVAR